MENISNVIAIDGPSGTGKSSITKALAKKYQFFHVNSGSLFRSLALYINDNFELASFLDNSADEAFALIKNIKVDYQKIPKFKVTLNGIDYTERLYDHEVSDLTSKVSGHPGIRQKVDESQREIVVESSEICLVEGRDIGTVVFPNAQLKFFLTASAEVRGQRRYDQLNEQGKLEGLTLEQIITDIKKRDARDSNREVAPLKKADDAIEIDTTKLSFDQVMAQFENIIEKEIKDLP